MSKGDDRLEKLRGLKWLASLDLRGADVTDNSLKELVRFKRLTDLDLRDTGVTGAGGKELQQALPNCKIVR